MTYEQFWEQDCELVKYYRKAAQIRQDLEDQNAWLQGAYIYEALVDAAPLFRDFVKKGTKPTPYRTTPFGMFETKGKTRKKVVQDRQDEKAKAFMQAFAVATNKRFQQKGGGVDGR